MKRVLVAVTALIAALAVGLATVSTTAGAAGGVAQVAKKKKKKKVPVAITLVIQSVPASTYSPGASSYSGQVSATKSVCFANRTVTISRNGAPVLSAVTGSGGAYQTSVNSAAAPGQYTASVAKKVKKKKKKKKKIVCLAATTAPITIP